MWYVIAVVLLVAMVAVAVYRWRRDRFVPKPKVDDPVYQVGNSDGTQDNLGDEVKPFGRPRKMP